MYAYGNIENMTGRALGGGVGGGKGGGRREKEGGEEWQGLLLMPNLNYRILWLLGHVWFTYS